MNLSLADSSKLHFLESIARGANKELAGILQSGRNLKVTLDNIDGRMIANQVCNVQEHFMQF